MTITTLLSWIGAAFAGAVSHELAHWIVWKLAGRKPKLHLRSMYVEPTAGPNMTVLMDRFAAAAPYLIGALALLTGWLWGLVIFMWFGLGMLFNPSRADFEAMSGNAEWKSLS